MRFSRKFWPVWAGKVTGPSPQEEDPLNLSGERGKHGDIVWFNNDWYWMPFQCCRNYKTKGCSIERAGKVAEVQ